MDEQVVGGDRAGPQTGGPRVGVGGESAEVLVFIGQRFGRLSPALANAVGELDHLVDGLLAVEAHDIVGHEPPEVVLGLTGEGRQRLDAHRHHDFGASPDG